MKTFLMGIALLSCSMSVMGMSEQDKENKEEAEEESGEVSSDDQNSDECGDNITNSKFLLLNGIAVLISKHPSFPCRMKLGELLRVLSNEKLNKEEASIWIDAVDDLSQPNERLTDDNRSDLLDKVYPRYGMILHDHPHPLETVKKDINILREHDGGERFNKKLDILENSLPKDKKT